MPQLNGCRPRREPFLLGCLPILLVGLGCTPNPKASTTAPAVRAAGASIQPSAVIKKGSRFGTDVIGLPTGASLTPDAAPGSVLLELDPEVADARWFRASGGVSTALSPDGRTLLVLTSGYNRTFDAEGDLVTSTSSEWVFVYDVTGGAPKPVQSVPVPNAFGGIAFGPTPDRFYLGGGSDDVVREYARSGPGARFAEAAAAIPLGHRQPNGGGGLGIGGESPYAAGVAVSPSGARLVVANHENDSVAVVDLAQRRLLGEVPLRPGGATPGGEFPYWVVFAGEDKAYVSCQRDREVVEVDVAQRKVTRRFGVGGQPVKMTLNRAGTRLFVANANSDTVSVVALPEGRTLSEIAAVPTPLSHDPASGAGAALRGSNPNDVALSSDEKTLFVTDGGNNAVSVIALGDRDRGVGTGGEASRCVGLVPTGFYPNAVTVGRTPGTSNPAAYLYVVHAKSPTGPNPRGPWSNEPRAALHPYANLDGHQYSLELMKGGLLAFPMPGAEVLAGLTQQVLENNRAATAPAVPEVFRALRGKVKHVIYVIGENRTYDQILGDLAGADGDPRLVHWGEAITPNHHELARQFVAMDRFFDSGGVSGDGWEWSTSGRTTDAAEKAIPVEYGDRGTRTYDWEGMSRAVNVALTTPAERAAANPHTPMDPDLLPGPVSIGAVDEPELGGQGFLWDAALAARVSVRNYGFFVDDARYGFPPGDPRGIPPLSRPFEAGVEVAYATRPSLLPVTDAFFRGFDMTVADFWRENEWEREFSRYEAEGDLPGLELVRLPHDHLGQFTSALDGVNTPDAQIADHDYALGRLVERVSHSRFWSDTVIVAIEDDAQNGSDHVDAHRSLALFAGGHVRRRAHVPTVYTTTSLLRTLELLLGLAPLGQTDAFAEPMADVFTTDSDDRPFDAAVPNVLRATRLPLPPPKGSEHAELPRGTPGSWAILTQGFDFRRADALPAARFNRILYCELVSSEGCASERPVMACGGKE